MNLCGSNSCIFGSPVGPGTNGPCSCFDALTREESMHVRRAIIGIRQQLKSVTTIARDYQSRAKVLRGALSSLMAALDDVPVAFGVHVHDALDAAKEALSPVPTACSNCWHHATDHTVDDEERRGCTACECIQYGAPQ